MRCRRSTVSTHVGALPLAKRKLFSQLNKTADISTTPTPHCAAGAVGARAALQIRTAAVGCQQRLDNESSVSLHQTLSLDSVTGSTLLMLMLTNMRINFFYRKRTKSAEIYNIVYCMKFRYSSIVHAVTIVDKFWTAKKLQ